MYHKRSNQYQDVFLKALSLSATFLAEHCSKKIQELTSGGYHRIDSEDTKSTQLQTAADHNVEEAAKHYSSLHPQASDHGHTKP